MQGVHTTTRCGIRGQGVLQASCERLKSAPPQVWVTVGLHPSWAVGENPGSAQCPTFGEEESDPTCSHVGGGQSPYSCA